MLLFKTTLWWEGPAKKDCEIAVPKLHQTLRTAKVLNGKHTTAAVPTEPRRSTTHTTNLVILCLKHKFICQSCPLPSTVATADDTTKAYCQSPHHLAHKTNDKWGMREEIQSSNGLIQLHFSYKSDLSPLPPLEIHTLCAQGNFGSV
nr:LOW QUALITY PROTEIN: hypothetical protein L204_00359 [Cryptococcus depauperatus CBS 7855]